MSKQITESGNNEWCTPTEYLLSARAVMGDIDLDPASNDVANVWIQAHKYFTKDDDGLSKKWKGRVWLNPPYSRDLMPKFIDKLISSKKVKQYICLTNASTDTKWFHALMEDADVVCFTKSRISFIGKDNKPVVNNNRGQAFFYKGKNVFAFALEFERYGRVLKL